MDCFKLQDDLGVGRFGKKSKVHSNPMIPHEHHLALPENALSQDPLVDSHLCITLAITGGTRCTHVYPIFRHIILGLSLFFASHPNSRRLKKRVLWIYEGVRHINGDFSDFSHFSNYGKSSPKMCKSPDISRLNHVVCRKRLIWTRRYETLQAAGAVKTWVNCTVLGWFGRIIIRS